MFLGALLLSIVAAAASDPLYYTSPFAYAYSPYRSAALVQPSAAVVAPASVVAPAALPYSAYSAYSYGSSYSIQDYLAPPAAAAYTYGVPLPYAEWYYRK